MADTYGLGIYLSYLTLNSPMAHTPHEGLPSDSGLTGSTMLTVLYISSIHVQ